MTEPTNYHMSLFYVLLNGVNLNPDFYACPPEGFERVGRRRVLGTYFLLSGTVLLILYTLCLRAMLSKELIQAPAYKIMISLAICDILSLFTNSIVTGFFGFFGLTYCDFPLFVFICGAHGFGCWLGCSITCVTLAVCRISELNPKLPLNALFRGFPMKLIIGWFAVTVIFGTYFTKPVIFRLEFMSWFFDPGVGKEPDSYTNMFHTVNNMAQAVLTSLLYAILGFTIFTKSKNTSMHFSASQRQFCYQAAVICLAHNISSSVYVYMQFFPTPTWLIAAEQVGWQMCTGGVCLVYLTFNKTIRVSVKKMLGIHLIAPHNSASQNVSQVSVTVLRVLQRVQ